MKHDIAYCGTDCESCGACAGMSMFEKLEMIT